MKGGYEIGIHSMREHAKRAAKTGEVVLLLDFQNAFNSVDRNLMLRLCAAHLPELAKLAFWIYENEPNLSTSNGKAVKSSTGTQQGCMMSNPLFALVIAWINRRIRQKGLKTQFFWDDGALVGDPETIAVAAETIHGLNLETGLNLRWDKCYVHCRNETDAQALKPRFERISKEIKVIPSLNMTYLKVPIGSDDWVAESLTEKLDELKTTIERVTAMTHRHEAFTLLRSCVLPPRQAEPFIKQYDRLLRQGLEKILDIPHLEPKWWRVAKLPAKYGGLGLRSGLSTLGAQHTVSLVKCTKGVRRFIPNFEPRKIIEQETKEWLSEKLENANIDVPLLIKKIEDRGPNPTDDPNSQENPTTSASNDSLAQLCELFEEKRVYGRTTPHPRQCQQTQPLAHHLTPRLSWLQHERPNLQNRHPPQIVPRRNTQTNHLPLL